MSNKEPGHSLELRTETMQRQGVPQGDGVTIKNDTQHNALLYLKNTFWGDVSMGYVRSGNSVTLPSVVNVDAYALFESVSQVFLKWPGPEVFFNKKKINLTPGQTYSLSSFD